MRVLYLSYDGVTDPLGQSQVLPYIEGLSKKGVSFTIISFEKSAAYQKSAVAMAERLKQSGIEWVPLMYTKKPPVLSTLWDVWQMYRAAEKLIKQNSYDIVHCRSYISALVGQKLKKHYGTKFVFDMRGFYADERVDGHIWNLSNPVYNTVYHYFKRKEKDFLSEADYVISLTNKAKGIIHSWEEIPGQPIPIQVIPCCADLDLFTTNNIKPDLQQQLRQQFNLTGNEFVLSYLGSIGTWYMLPEMLDFFKVLLQKRPDSRFLFITTDNPDHIYKAVQQKGINKDRIIVTPAERKSLPTFLSLSSWSIFFIKPVFSKSASSPTKQGEIMGMGIPHVCNAGVGDVDEVLSAYKGSGIVVPDFTAPCYEAAISKMLKPSTGTAPVPEVYSLKLGVSKYAEVYRTLAGHQIV